MIDVPRTMSLDGLQNRMLNHYLPGGENLVQGLQVADIDFHLATFNGGRLPETIDGIPFSVEMYCGKLATYPVRVYLHTCSRSHEVRRTIKCVLFVLVVFVFSHHKARLRYGLFNHVSLFHCG